MVNIPISIVGGGPAGSSTGIFLAKKGFDKITLYERDINRRKPCGGGLTIRTTERYGKTLLKDLELNHNKSMLLDIDGKVFRYTSKKPFVSVIDRLILDKHLRSLAESEGVTIVEKQVEPNELNDNIVIDARGFEPKLNQCILRVAICKLKNPELSFIFRSKATKVGYFWIFPIDDRLADVGVGAVTNTLKIPINSAFNWFIKKINAKPINNMSWALTFASWTFRKLVKNINGKFIIKVGERAGLVNPYLGEGIYHAIRSAEILAESITDIKNYETYIKRNCHVKIFGRSTEILAE